MNEDKNRKNTGSEPRREGTAGKKTEGASKRITGSEKRAGGAVRRAAVPGNRPEGASRRAGTPGNRPEGTSRRAGALESRPEGASRRAGAPGNRPEGTSRRAGTPGNRPEGASHRPGSPEKRTGGTSRRPNAAGTGAGNEARQAGNAERRSGSTSRRPSATEIPANRTPRQANSAEKRPERAPRRQHTEERRVIHQPDSAGTVKKSAGNSEPRADSTSRRRSVSENRTRKTPNQTNASAKRKGRAQDVSSASVSRRQEEKGSEKKKKRSGRKLIVVLLVVLILIATALAAAETGGRFAGSKDVKFTVKKGEGTHTIADRLEEEGLIGNSLLFRIVSRFNGGDGEWDYGTHKIAGGSSYKEIIAELTSPQTASIKVTLPEGKQVCQMADILEEKGICKKKAFMKACTEKSYGKWTFLKGIPTKKRINGLEGYLFPDTYYFEKNTDPDQVIETMLSRFEEKVYTESVRKKAKKMGFSIDEIVILASMAESEAVTKADRRTVSGVFLNRLEKDDKLQSCVTVEYAKRMKKTIISLEDTKYDSPYNTYMYKGLPFGPICCPGMQSIEAVLYDDNNDYYYFQSDEKGRLHFAVTFAEHRKIQKEVQKDWEVKTTKIE